MLNLSNHQIYVAASICIAFAVFLAIINIRHRRYRSSLTQAERDQEDRDANVGGDW